MDMEKYINIKGQTKTKHLPVLLYGAPYLYFKIYTKSMFKHVWNIPTYTKTEQSEGTSHNRACK